LLASTLLVALSLFGSARPAQACLHETGARHLLLFGVNFGLTVYDSVLLVEGKRPALGFAITELAIAAPQALFSAHQLLRSDSFIRKCRKQVLLSVLAWSSVLTAHGTYYAINHKSGDGDSSPDPTPLLFTLGARF